MPTSPRRWAHRRLCPRFPEREFNFGIAEQNMVAAAAGMATTGLIPFVSTYAVFVTLRALDQVRNSICYPQLNVKIAASHGGITPGPDGVTHQGQEDLSIMRTLPNMTVAGARRLATTELAIHAAAAWRGRSTSALPATRCPTSLADYPFAIGRAVTVRRGNDATIVANRDMVAHALVAAESWPEGLEVAGARLPHPQAAGRGSDPRRRARDRAPSSPRRTISSMAAWAAPWPNCWWSMSRYR